MPPSGAPLGCLPRDVHAMGVLGVATRFRRTRCGIVVLFHVLASSRDLGARVRQTGTTAARAGPTTATPGGIPGPQAGRRGHPPQRPSCPGFRRPCRPGLARCRGRPPGAIAPSRSPRCRPLRPLHRHPGLAVARMLVVVTCPVGYQARPGRPCDLPSVLPGRAACGPRLRVSRVSGCCRPLLREGETTFLLSLDPARTSRSLGAGRLRKSPRSELLRRSGVPWSEAFGDVGELRVQA
jgi:hypothetical protein